LTKCRFGIAALIGTNFTTERLRKDLDQAGPTPGDVRQQLEAHAAWELFDNSCQVMTASSAPPHNS
jgi:hypothetical protein